MKTWQDFLDSLSTAGGNIFVLVVCVVAIGLFVLHTAHHGSDSELVELSKDTLAGFTGALLQSLRGNSSKQQMVDRNLSILAPAAAAPKQEPNAQGS